MALGATHIEPADTMESQDLKDLSEVLFTGDQIAARVAALGEYISQEYQGKNLVIIGVLKGVVLFLADLMREIRIPVQFDVVGASSYRSGKDAAPQVSITKDLDIDLHGKDVLILEDIYDTGRTLQVVYEMVKLYNPASIEVCALLYKTIPRERVMPVKYVGFEIGNVFVVGYGLDYKERYRNLRCIGVLNPEIYE